MHKKTSLLLALIWTGIITVLSLVNVGGLGSGIKIPYKDKIVHFVFYFLFYVMWCSFFKKKSAFSLIKFPVLFFAIGYGMLMELLQAIMGNHRSSDWLDVIANSLGAISAMLLISYFLSNKKHI